MKKTLLLLLSAYLLIGCKTNKLNSESFKGSVSTSGYEPDSLPPPYATPSSKNFSKVIGWQKGNTPLAPKGFNVTKFADDLEHPRWIYVADNGDIFVAESNTILKGIKKFGAKLSRKIKTQHYGESANRITLFRDVNKDGIPEERFIFLENLNQPFGMLIIDNYFYVANTDALKRYPYKEGITHIEDSGTTIMSLPAGKYNQHWTRNIVTNAAKDKIYIAVGSSSNIGEHGLEDEKSRAAIHEINIDGTQERLFATGLRNPVGMAWAPGTKKLWTVVNERDELGDELVPDYLTGVKENGFYGWPFLYNGDHKEPRLKAQAAFDTVKTAIVLMYCLVRTLRPLVSHFVRKKCFLPGITMVPLLHNMVPGTVLLYPDIK
jgi:glucose/arabinose dehydrogenase